MFGDGPVEGTAVLVHGVLGGDDFPVPAEQEAVADLLRAATVGALSVDVAPPRPLAEAAAAHEQVDAGVRARVLLDVTA